MSAGPLQALDPSSALPDGAKPYEDEGLFARDINGQLIRVERATASDFDLDVHLKIDGLAITVKKAVPERDSQGNILRDANGQPRPRFTTIYDATSQAFVKQPGDVHPIPTLCHKEHLPPIGACRVCIVEAAEQTRQGLRSKLVPSCWQHVSEGMEVHTLESQADAAAAKRVHEATKTITELLVADHLPMVDGHCPSSESMPGNELARLAERLGIECSRFAPRTLERGKDTSSPMVVVNHDDCILCGRCVRGCNYVKNNRVIGRSNKGYETVISFDLNVPMNDSTCVECGECAISCPTSAMEFVPQYIQQHAEKVLQELQREGKNGGLITAHELSQIELFSGIPFKFLQLNAASVIRRKLAPGEILCQEGEYGSTAFIILDGEFEIFLNNTRGAVRTRKAGGIRGLLGGLKTIAEKAGGFARLTDVGGAALGEDQKITRSKKDLILGEMTCMNRYPRSATVKAITDAEVLEIKRNVLYMLQRNEVSRELLNRVYRERALQGQIERLPIFAELDEESRKEVALFLKEKVDLVSVEPGQTIFEQGDRADHFYVVRLGFVKVTRQHGRTKRVMDYLGPGRNIGEIGLLSQSAEWFSFDEDDKFQRGVRTATCSALDHVELIRIRGEHFRELMTRYPQLVTKLRDQVQEILRRNKKMLEMIAEANEQDFLEQGLYLAQNLLVLDLERCTRCDECTKACADTHGGVTRLVRDGLRFEKFLIASSCRSCMDPYCLVGCPVDAIHRKGETLEIAIDDYCIGCGLCADNCPYGNINMHPFPKINVDPQTKKKTKAFQIVDGKKLPVLQQRATTCDLCHSVDSQPSCVYACPHNAAFRMSGEQLLKLTAKNNQLHFS